MPNVWKPIKDKDINKMTVDEFRELPCKSFNDTIKPFNSLIILPADSPNDGSVSETRLAHFAANRMLHNDTKPHIHNNGYRFMSFIAAIGDNPICIVGDCADIIHIQSSGGISISDRKTNVIQNIPWTIDCLPKSGLLRLFAGTYNLSVGFNISSFEVFTAAKRKKNEKEKK